MNVAMILEMAADALGDRVAFGDLDDGLTYDAAAHLRRGPWPSGSRPTRHR